MKAHCVLCKESFESLYTVYFNFRIAWLSLSARTRGFYPGPLRVRFAVDEVHLGRFFAKDFTNSHSAMLDIHLFTLTLLFTRTTSRRSLGTFKQSNVLLAVGKHVIKNYFHMFKTSENSGWLRLVAVNFTTTHLPNKLPLRNIISGVYWKYSANASGRCKDKDGVMKKSISSLLNDSR